jgi:hypothetical protein
MILAGGEEKQAIRRWMGRVGLPKPLQEGATA